MLWALGVSQSGGERELQEVSRFTVNNLSPISYLEVSLEEQSTEVWEAAASLR